MVAELFLLVNDLFFADRLGNGIRQAGHEAVVADLSFGDSWTPPARTRLAIIDLEAGPPALQAIGAARSRGVPVLAFGPHTDLELRQQALEAGADKVVAKSKLTSSLPELIAEMLKGG